MSQTLKKITFTDLASFVESINANFAIVENSPLYKGIPGNRGADGVGIPGQRGTKFIFVSYIDFVTVFGSELSAPSQITLTYINTKLSTFQLKKQLLTALKTTDLVHGDIIILTNSSMVQYDVVLNIVTDTKMAFNEDTNMAASIEQTIEDYVSSYINSHPSLQADTILSWFPTFAKNYADTNNSGVNGDLTSTSIYAPFYPGVSNDQGMAIPTHKYFSYTDAKVPEENIATIVFGSIKRYIDLLFNTVSTGTGSGMLTSDYAPGQNRTPAAIILQNDAASGIMFGLSTANDLSKFAHIYKDSGNRVVIKTDGGKLATDYSMFTLDNIRGMRYDRAVNFLDNLTIRKNLIVTGQISHQLIKTGMYTESTDADTLELGDISSTIRFKTDKLYLERMKNLVLVTDNDGKLRSDVTIETNEWPKDGFINGSNRLATTRHITTLSNAVENLELWKQNQAVSSYDVYTRSQLSAGIDGNIRIKTGVLQTDNLVTIAMDNVLSRQSTQRHVLTLGGSAISNLELVVDQSPTGAVSQIYLGSRGLIVKASQSIANDARVVVGAFWKGALQKDVVIEQPMSSTIVSQMLVPVSTTDQANAMPIIPPTDTFADNKRLITFDHLKNIYTFISSVKNRFQNTYNKTESVKFLNRLQEIHQVPLTVNTNYWLNDNPNIAISPQSYLTIDKYGSEIILKMEFANTKTIINGSYSVFDNNCVFALLVEKRYTEHSNITGITTVTKSYGSPYIRPADMLHSTFTVYNVAKNQSLTMYATYKKAVGLGYGGNAEGSSSTQMDVIQLCVVTDGKTIPASGTDITSPTPKDYWRGQMRFLTTIDEDYNQKVLTGYVTL